MNNSFRLGFFVEKDNVINYNVVFTREVGIF